jgi:hypothetical protein
MQFPTHENPVKETYLNPILTLILQIRALHTIGCGHLSKIFLSWSNPWWASGEGGITLAWTQREMESRTLPRDWSHYVSNFSEVESQPKMLCCWIAGSGARVVDQIKDAEVSRSKLRIISRKEFESRRVPRLRDVSTCVMTCDSTCDLTCDSTCDSVPALACDAPGQGILLRWRANAVTESQVKS